MAIPLRFNSVNKALAYFEKCSEVSENRAIRVGIIVDMEEWSAGSILEAEALLKVTRLCYGDMPLRVTLSGPSEYLAPLVSVTEEV